MTTCTSIPGKCAPWEQLRRAARTRANFFCLFARKADCAICLSETPDTALVCCGGCFHFNCLNEWVAKDPTNLREKRGVLCAAAACRAMVSGQCRRERSPRKLPPLVPSLLLCRLRWLVREQAFPPLGWSDKCLVCRVVKLRQRYKGRPAAQSCRVPHLPDCIL